MDIQKRQKNLINTTEVRKMSIQVWQTADGVKYAAEQTDPDFVSFYRYDENAVYPHNHIYGTLALMIGETVKDAVEDPNKNWDKDLPWIVSRELERAAKDQNPTPARSLADAISYPERIKIDEATRDELVQLLGKGCRESTKQALHYALTGELNLKSYGIYSRLMISPTVSYCAGQDYRAELTTIRKLLIQ
jgi:hypothetical protein